MASFASEVSISQSAEFFSRFGRLGGNMAKLQKLLGDDELMKTLIEQLDEPCCDLTDLIPDDGWAAEYMRFYQEVFGLTVDFSAVEIPIEEPGFGWVVYVTKRMTINEAWKKAKGMFLCGSLFGDDLDFEVTFHDRMPTKAAYAKRFRDRVDADEENMNLSANVLAERKTQNITLLERILLELWYFWKTGGNHLDVGSSITLCAGSRFPGGRVPCVMSKDIDGVENVKFTIFYSCPGAANESLRSRSAV